MCLKIYRLFVESVISTREILLLMNSTQEVIDILSQWMLEAIQVQDLLRYKRLRLDYDILINAKRNEN